MAKRVFSGTSSVGPQFARVTDPAEVRRILKQVEEELPLAVLWDPLRGEALKGRIELTDIEGEWSLRGEWMKQTIDLGHSFTHVFGILYPKQPLLLGFVPEEMEGLGAGNLLFKAPSELYKIQRRKDQRAVIPRGYEIWATFPSPLKNGDREQARILDLSEKGLGILVTQAQADACQKGMILPNVQFQIRGRRMNGSLQIQSLSRLKGDEVKIGGAWLKLSDADRAWLSQYVAEWGI